MPRDVSKAIDLLQKHLKTLKKNHFFSKGNTKLDELLNRLKAFDKIKYNPENNEEKKARDDLVASLKYMLENEIDSSVGVFANIKDIVYENFSYYSGEPIYCYWNGSKTISDVPPGIAILTNDTRKKSRQINEPFPIDFKERVLQNLEYLYLLPTGKILLEELLRFSRNNSLNEHVFILPQPSHRGNSIAYQDPSHALHMVADELLRQDTKKHLNVAVALERATDALELEDPYQWLADQINQMPQLKYLGMPEDKSYLQEKGIVFSKKDIENWLNGQLDIKDEIKTHFLNSVIIALQKYSTSNTGTGSIIRWNPAPAYKTNQRRPIAIGLGHELCHAYYNAIGMQPGYQDFDESTVLYEYLTTGLGVWKEVEISENALRREWNGILSQIPATDVLNHKTVERRLYYDMEEDTSLESSNSCKII